MMMISAQPGCIAVTSAGDGSEATRYLVLPGPDDGENVPLFCLL